MPLNSVRAPSRPRRLIIATGNPGKLREFRALLAGLPFELSSLADLGIPSPEETGATFLANAALKARHAAEAAAAASGGTSESMQIAAIADDSGLEVDALGGAPGVYSARFAGVGASDAENNAKLAAALEGLPRQERGARYRCVLVFVRGALDADPLIAEAVWEGQILEAPRGAGGFGYDPYFWLPDLRLSAAELDPALKNRLSHRGRALRMLRDRLARDLPTVPTPPAVPTCGHLS
jgi:XTP/dITP diphosphohydrolase